MSALSSLSLAYLTNLKNIFEINKLNTLSMFQVEKCKKLRDLTLLEKNRSIEDLCLVDADFIDFVPGMVALKTIKFCSLVYGGIEPLLNSETLQQVELYPMKKYYSHSKDKINQRLAK